MKASGEPIAINYQCSFPAIKRRFDLSLRFDALSFDLLNRPDSPLPEWCRMEFHRCPNCRLKVAEGEPCPVAAQLCPIVENCHDIESYQVVDMEVTTPERKFVQTTTAQRALSSLMGLIMSTAGCPLLSSFRPMARFHLPGSTDDETLYRVVTMYLLSRYVAHRKGWSSGLELNGLLRIYREVEALNKAMVNRLEGICKNDAIINGLIRLNQYAQIIPLAMEEYLDRLHPLFDAFFREDSIHTHGIGKDASAATNHGILPLSAL